jgi:hypothetical protein
VEAEQMYQRALRGYYKVLGPEHTSTLTTINNLCLIYNIQGKFMEAEEKTLGPNASAPLTS